MLAEWSVGATIVLQALHVHWLPLAVFCRELEAGLDRPVQANAYYTPRRSRGFGLHHDTHDVLVLQVAGEKRWILHEPLLELPLKHQRYSAALGDPGPPSDDLLLRPGDTLYLPRGWLHRAETSATDSLHLTIGIGAYTWIDAFRAALSDCEDELGFRRGVSRKDDVAELLELLRGRLALDDVERRRRARFVSGRRPVVEDGLSQLRRLELLAPDTLVERRPTVIADLREDGGEVVVAFEGKEVRLPSHVLAEVEGCLDGREPFRPADLPGDLDEEGRLVLVRRLVREGLLRVSGP